MRTFLPLEPELDRIIRLLRGTNIRLSVMSITVNGFAPSAMQIAVRAAVNPADLTGELPDGSIGVISLRSMGPDGGFAVEEKFVSAIRLLLATACEMRDQGEISVQLRSIHRWAAELQSTGELLRKLFVQEGQPFTVTARSNSDKTSRIAERARPIFRSNSGRAVHLH